MSTLADTTTTHDHHGSGELNRGQLARELQQVVRGEVRFDEASRHLYANDASIYRFVPAGVVIPRDEEDVVAAVEVCRRHHAPIHARGGGTGLAGQTVNTGVVFDFSKYMNRILSVDAEGRTARVQPGAICDDVRKAAFEHGLTFAPDPATHDHNTLGGMIGNNSCGTHSVYGGKTVDNVLELDVLLYDGTRLTLGVGEEQRLQEIIDGGGRRGEIYAGLRDLRDEYGDLIRQRYPDIPRRVSGYNLDDLLPEKGFNTARALVGSESTCLLVLSATLRLLPWPPKHTLVALGYPDSPAAAEHVVEVLDTDPMGLEFFEYGVLDNLHRKHFPTPGEDELPPGHTFVFVEYGGQTQEESDAAARRLVDRLQQLQDRSTAKVISDPEVQDDVWELRKGAIGSTKIPGEHAGYAGWEDAAVHPSRLSDYLRDFRSLVDGYGYHTVLFGHFGQGCIHNRLDLDIATQSGIDTFGRFLSDAADLAVRYGGSLSGEHGDGQLRAAFLPRMFGPELVTAFERFKDLFDPDGAMNPGKVVRPNSPVDDLREGVDYRPPDLTTHFSFAEDGGWAGAADRCFGVGKCRHLEGGTMCPSFMVTREEKHSTRGRARMLFEMMQTAGERSDPWRDEGVKDALDLCLACKGCKGDCPVRVDMATYKAEFLSHYYEGRLRPRTAYAMGLIQQWARLASIAPHLVNRLGSWSLTAPLLKAVAGVAQDRQVPQFAGHTFRASLDRSLLGGAGAPVLLWADTFTNHFQPQVAEAAVRVLRAAGFAVQVPDQHLCCGRPLYDYGMLPTARRYLEQVRDALRPQIEAGVPVVGLEPSCVAVFRDELPGMLPEDPLARRLADQTLTLAELLGRYAPSWRPPRLDRKALVQVHCHQGAVIGFDSERALLERTGLDLEVPDSGCCGMAGSFGYEAGERYDVSIACGERVILPKVRDAAADTLILADGFSCREQIEQNTDRQALHLAQVLDLAMNGDDPALNGDEPAMNQED
ncbi:MAG TPA: FAD-binding and (Fe-S)-binding domain-containing protein [Segeticoccus sp.]|uniref:FAD-binding and (Fe-S)-binding domain-containing protein n=1 Tax=Segeticoccus sp. TaxID=2706531 RepID=UPI002D805A75|nr:FAD-binding and (Fe-S)-binding domain-containing protein [Segeticoccus sp.]HET8599885.1 FAD-binding and (Fe-S)-binding domain-containing protein [Segeticoccus sp.]